MMPRLSSHSTRARSRTTWALALLLVAAVSSFAQATSAENAFAPPTDLQVTLVDPLNITLEWQDHATHERGYFVEYKLYRNEDFVVLGTVLPTTLRFRHENLAPETRFIYRVRPFFGRVTPVVTTKTAKAPQVASTDDAWATPVHAPHDTTGEQKSVRATASAAQATPDNFSATLVAGTGIKLTWRDRASDEDGYIVEIKVGNDPDFRVCALLDPDTVSFGLAGLPEETKIATRVRAFFYGEPSNTAEKMTGTAPAAPASP